jgi:hypothetical protein
MAQNSYDIPYANTIDMLVHAYLITVNKLWLIVESCIVMSSLYVTA